MHPVTSAFREAIIAGDQAAIVQVGVQLDDSLIGILPVTAGTVDCDGTRDGALRSLSLTISPHPDAFSWLAAAGAEIVVERGLALPASGFGYFVDLIPTMTSPIDPSGVASASSELEGMNYAAFKAANDSLTTGLYDRWAIAGTSGWWQYQFPEPQTITQYTLRSQNYTSDGTTKAPKSWTFRGSNNGIDWVTLDTQMDITDWGGTSWNMQHTYPVSNGIAYAYVRLDFSASNDAGYIVLGEIEMMGTRAGTPAGEELVPLGVYILDADLEEAEDGTITVSAADRSQRISRARWTDPYTVPAGMNVGEGLADLLMICWPDCPVGATLVAIDKVTTAKAVYLDGADSDPWKDARALAASAGYDLYFDGAGDVQVRETPDPESAPVCATYYAGEKAIILGQVRSARLSQMYNGVIATAEGSGVGIPKRGEAWDEDPSSPTYSDGPMGRVPLFYSSPILTTQDDVDSAAQTMLARVKRPIEQTSFTLVPNPAHEAFDVVEFVDSGGVARRFMFDVVSIPLDTSGPMTATARETEVT